MVLIQLSAHNDGRQIAVLSLQCVVEQAGMLLLHGVKDFGDEEILDRSVADW